MRTIALDRLEYGLQQQMRAAMREPVLITDGNRPLLVIRSLLEDDTADELIASHPAFQESIQRAREQKDAGQVRSLQALRQKYNAN